VLRTIAEQLGQLVAAGAIVEAFAKASLEEAAAGCGLIRDLGAKPVKSAIAAAIKAGKKTPRDLGTLAAAAARAWTLFKASCAPAKPGIAQLSCCLPLPTTRRRRTLAFFFFFRRFPPVPPWGRERRK
jgi:hypothetical protein